MEDYSVIFRKKLSTQAEVCARKALEWLQKDLQNTHELEPEDAYYLAATAQIMLTLRDKYGQE